MAETLLEWMCAIAGMLLLGGIGLHVEWTFRERRAREWREQVRHEAEEAARRTNADR